MFGFQNAWYFFTSLATSISKYANPLCQLLLRSNYASLTGVILRLQTATGSRNGPISYIRSQGVAA